MFAADATALLTAVTVALLGGLVLVLGAALLTIALLAILFRQLWRAVLAEVMKPWKGGV